MKMIQIGSDFINVDHIVKVRFFNRAIPDPDQPWTQEQQYAENGPTIDVPDAQVYLDNGERKEWMSPADLEKLHALCDESAI